MELANTRDEKGGEKQQNTERKGREASCLVRLVFGGDDDDFSTRLAAKVG